MFINWVGSAVRHMVDIIAGVFTLDSQMAFTTSGGIC